MEVWYGAEQVPASLSAPGGPGSVVTIGVFDGVHRGHQAILSRVVERARRAGGAGPLAVAVTFDPHPVLVHHPEAHLPMVASLADRLTALAATGLDAVLVIPYTLDFADQGPEEFVRPSLAASPLLPRPKRTSSPTTTARAPSSSSSQVRTNSSGPWSAKSRV